MHVNKNWKVVLPNVFTFSRQSCEYPTYLLAWQLDKYPKVLDITQPDKYPVVVDIWQSEISYSFSCMTTGQISYSEGKMRLNIQVNWGRIVCQFCIPTNISTVPFMGQYGDTIIKFTSFVMYLLT